MNTRRLIILCALAGSLLAIAFSANAEERGGTVGTAIGSTTIGGYVDSSVSDRIQQRGWWRGFFHWLRFHLR